jgi:hypothetical protein
MGQERCSYASLLVDPNNNAQNVRYKRPDEKQKLAAGNYTGLKKKTNSDLNDNTASASSFPAPLVLPDDLLSRY